MSAFAEQIAAFGQKVGLRMDLVVRKVTFDLYRDIVIRTPVDTGRARANYQIAIGQSIPSGVVEAFDKSGTANLGATLATLKEVKAGGVVRIVNNLPYIMRLEFGWSKQAPAGMARITVAEWQDRVNAVIGEVNK